MPLYVIERNYAEQIDTTAEGVTAVGSILDANEIAGVDWLFSFLSADRKKTYCIYDGPSPEAIRRAAELNSLPVDGISEVRVLDPYFYIGAGS